METQVLPVNEQSIALAARLLQHGELVALPTETVYGIAADARNGEAVRKIYVENFPAFIIVDDKGNDFFAEFKK